MRARLCSAFLLRTRTLLLATIKRFRAADGIACRFLDSISSPRIYPGSSHVARDCDRRRGRRSAPRTFDFPLFFWEVKEGGRRALGRDAHAGANSANNGADCTQQLTSAASTSDYDHRPAIISLQGEPRTSHLAPRGPNRASGAEVGIGSGRDRPRCPRNLDICNRNLGADRNWAKRARERSSPARRLSADPRVASGPAGGGKEGKGENGLVALWVDFAAGRPPHLRRSCRTNVLAFWPGWVGARGRSRGGAPRTR